MFQKDLEMQKIICLQREQQETEYDGAKLYCEKDLQEIKYCQNKELNEREKIKVVQRGQISPDAICYP